MITAEQALERLREGNRRFVAEAATRPAPASLQARRAELASRQEPFAVVVGCSDSRVPPEQVFDQGLGDLFVVRVAGNIAAPSPVDSVTFAATQLRSPLVVVLGHSRCGAVQATLEGLQQEGGGSAPDLRATVDRIRPAVEPLLATALRENPEALVREAVRANIRTAADGFRHGSAALEALVHGGDLLVVGAEYSLLTGEVEFFEGVPS